MSEIIAFPVDRTSPRSHVVLDPEFAPDGTAWDVCPWSVSVTEYDKRHIGLFYRLMYDESEGASEVDIARDVFGMSFWLQSQKARLIVRSHMRRARWLAENVFPLLGW